MIVEVFAVRNVLFWSIIPSDLTHPMQGTIPHKGLNIVFPTTTVDGSEIRLTSRGW